MKIKLAYMAILILPIGSIEHKVYETVEGDRGND